MAQSTGTVDDFDDAGVGILEGIQARSVVDYDRRVVMRRQPGVLGGSFFPRFTTCTMASASCCWGTSMPARSSTTVAERCCLTSLDFSEARMSSRWTNSTPSMGASASGF